MHTLALAADQGLEQYHRPTKRDMFLQTINEIVPWSELCAVIEPYSPKAGNAVRRRVWSGCCAFTWCSTGQPGKPGVRGVVAGQHGAAPLDGNDLDRERVPDATTLLKFCRQLEKHKLGDALFAKMGEVLQARAESGMPHNEVEFGRRARRAHLSITLVLPAGGRSNGLQFGNRIWVDQRRKVARTLTQKNGAHHSPHDLHIARFRQILHK